MARNVLCSGGWPGEDRRADRRSVARARERAGKRGGARGAGAKGGRGRTRGAVRESTARHAGGRRGDLVARLGHEGQVLEPAVVAGEDGVGVLAAGGEE